ncbi:Holliday junction resolvase RecU [Psychrobacillus vulpis]|uniref:Holliday junction resolvase RecU n=1 Tax=Psychrobacillus vulpis TaxID=2325572 RepID=A0A544TQL9_9BACI|nr:Holliday junction resolvase RecU [Psychrobacillus vulpis]TQR19741.1 Holliday junction resolvase RecU [Psychrobacillus vulpis]
MAIRYPNGKVYTPKKDQSIVKKKDYSFSNRGKTLEDEINDANEYYLTHGIAVIYKKPIPIQVVKVDYPSRSSAVIKEAYYRTASTTDFNGVYEGKYIDFEAKETENRTAFPLKNVHLHQVEHMRKVVKQHGICFLLVRFSAINRYFYLPFEHLGLFWDRMQTGGRKSIALSEFEEHAIEISPKYAPRIDYLEIVKNLSV